VKVPFSLLNSRVKVLSSTIDQDQQQQQLTAPLLLEQYCDSDEYYPPNTTMAVNGHQPFFAAEQGGLLYRLVSMRCVSDTLPSMFYTILTNGKFAGMAFIGFFLIMLVLWLPFWLLSFVVTEWGVYATAVGSIYMIGRSIIRLIAFPGASRKVVTDIEGEFAKYSVRMVEAACNSLIDLAAVFEPRDQSGEQHLDSRTLHQVPGLWRRVKSFRDRVLGVYLEVLRYIYQQDSVLQLSLSDQTDSAHASNPSIYGPGLTRYGNNRLSGDVGNFATLTVRAL
jgi:hypothetical protein